MPQPPAREPRLQRLRRDVPDHLPAS